jgi:hypothetical protein
MPFKFNSNGRHHIPRQRRRVTNWRDNDTALCNRGSLTIWYTEEALAGWRAQPRMTPGGQRHYSDLAIEPALTLRAAFRLALHQSEGLIGLIMRMVDIDLLVPDHTTLAGVRPVCRFTAAGEWPFEKHGTAKRRSWRKLHIGHDADSGEIVAFDLTDKDDDDALHVAPYRINWPAHQVHSWATALMTGLAFSAAFCREIRMLNSSCLHAKEP